MKIAGFAFAKNVSADTLSRLKNIDTCHLLYGVKSITKYIDILLNEQPEYILGMGQYFRGPSNRIRIETECKNNFRNYPIRSFLQPYKLSVFSKTIGSSYCNLISVKIMELITLGKLKSKYTYLHIPKHMPVEIAVQEIDSMLEELKSSL